MSWAHELLGVAVGSDERSVKRAYAQQLRHCRPDEDPEGFQRLRAAYEEALAHCAPRGDTGPTHRIAAPLEPAPLEPAPLEPAQIKLDRPLEDSEATARDTDTLIDSLLEIAKTGTPAELERWLEAQPEWWSLNAKPMMGMTLVARLARQPTSMPGECMDALMRFFGLDQVGAAVDPLQLKSLRTNMTIHWELQAENARALGRHVNPSPSALPDPKLAVRMYRQLARPLQFFQAVLFAMPMAHRPEQMVAFMQRLSRGHLQRLLPYMRGEQMSFWLDAANRECMSWPRFAIGTARMLACLLVAQLAIAGLYYMAEPLPESALAHGAYGAVAGWVCAIAGLWFAYAGWIALDSWQRAPEAVLVNRPRLRWAFIPLLGVLSVALKYGWDDMRIIADIAAVVAAALAIRRYRSRNHSAPLNARYPWLFGLLMLRAIYAVFKDAGGMGVPIVEIAGLLALGCWVADLLKERGRNATANA